MERKYIKWCTTVSAIAVISSITITATPSGARSSDDRLSELVGVQGEISFPQDFPNGFMFIGTFAVAARGEGVAELHSTYARPKDVAEFRQTGIWSDGAVLIKEVSSTIGARHTTGNAFWRKDTKTWFLMIKDAKGRFQNNPLWGDGWGWAQFDPKDTTKQIAKDYKSDCKQCHVPVATNDWIYTYGYPGLGIAGQRALPPTGARGASSAAPEAQKTEGPSAAPPPVPAGTATATMNQGHAAQGKAAFEENCGGCHSAVTGEGGTGPSLFGVFGRKAGSLAGYQYSAAMMNSNVVWSRETLEKHLADTRNFIPGNRMAKFFPGLDDATARSDIISYLETLK
ncbi:MAG: cytochrome P460 family protein [Methylocystis sp.]